MNKTVLVTGASRGIGRETAIQFAQSGYNVAIHYCSHKEEAVTLADELRNINKGVVTVQADISCRADVEKMVRQVQESIGPVDILVNNAGIAQQKLFSDITPDEWDRMFCVNVKGMYHCTQCVLPDMISKKSGKIINVSSIWGLTGASCEVHYSASKAAIIGMTKALAKELGPSNIQVNCVAPGVIATDMNAALDEETILGLKEETPLGRIGTPADIAHTILFLASTQADFITGQVLSPNGGFVI